MPRAFLITNKRYESTVSTQSDDKGQMKLHSRENSPERSVCTAEDPTSRDVNKGFCNSAESEEESFAPLKPSSPGSPASLFNHISVLAHTNGNALRLDANFANCQSRALDYTCPGTPSSKSVSSPPCYLSGLEDDEDQAQDLSLHHLRAGYPSAETCRTAHNTHPSYKVEQTDIHVCSDCGKRYSTSSNLARHRQTHRSVTDKKARKCPHCEKVYVSMPAYSMHVRTHSQGCQCPYCGKCFSRPWLLQGHIRTHTGEKPFKCPICSKAFADKSNLRAHVQTHSTTKPYVCQRCGKAFALKSYLYKHEESSCMRLHRHSHGQQRSVSLFASEASHRADPFKQVIK